MPDWNSRLEVTLNGSSTITPIESFTPTYTTPVTPIHSIEADNVGALYHPKTATFTMTVKAIGTSVLTLAQLGLAGTKFNIQLAEQKGTDWSFKKLLFRDCIITSANPSNAVMDGVPLATFSGIVLGFVASTDIEPG
ncbi:hypothetical protein [Bradyrhizobium sp.]|uniref:hypothetical protein n=1 Tax=Bradyrhizobium sp. TaxID=376 RepID=UPI001DEED53A|nr:hypothetical protein [Bradyrhizobium sp.]MBV8702041.1 hypothetical protein [Bradyrhizobium sp.]MBV8921124.1 hypothetical protein [Bradyrhizobium sp.]MBV9981125.1 hypothetical protein [Bradyrhizobium sp.]